MVCFPSVHGLYLEELQWRSTGLSGQVADCWLSGQVADCWLFGSTGYIRGSVLGRWPSPLTAILSLLP